MPEAPRVPDLPSALGAFELASVMAAFAAGLARHQETINRLNVYPVPDGDTGTNMVLTLEAVIAELAVAGVKLDGDGRVETNDVGLAEICRAIGHGSLMGARGNSGVILCQVLRGMTQGFVDLEAIGLAELVAGLRAADTAARAAVQRPVEGTILTVAAGAATAAEACLAAGGDLPAVLEAARGGAVEALARTPELLGVLAEAGVVDAGGAGLVLFFDAFLEVVCDWAPAEELELPATVRAVLRSAASPTGTAARVAALDELRYEVMYLLEAPDAAIGEFREAWAAIGDSIVVVGGEGIWNCHIHTDDIGAAIEAAIDVGRPREIRVTDLAEQVEEEQWVRSAGIAPATPNDGPPPTTSIVAVATGEGIRRIFRSLGVDHVVAGGQSMNPSTAEILAVVESVPGAEVVVLPNNGNILPVARQVATLASKPVRLVETRAIQEGFAALLAYDPQDSSEQNAEAMAAAASGVVTGEVTRAVRSTTSDAGPVKTGDHIGLARSGIVSVAGDLVGATTGLIGALLLPGNEIVTLIEGAGSSAADTRAVTEWLHEHHPELTVELLQGGQPLYPYLVSID